MQWRKLFDGSGEKLPAIHVRKHLPEHILSRPDIEARYERVLGRVTDALNGQQDSNEKVVDAIHTSIDGNILYARAYMNFRFARTTLEKLTAQRQSIVSTTRTNIIATLSPKAQQALGGPTTDANRGTRQYVKEFTDISKQNLLEIEARVEAEIGREFPGYQQSRSGKRHK